MLWLISTGLKTSQNHRFKIRPGRRESAVVPSRLVSKKRRKRLWGPFFTLNRPLQLEHLCGFRSVYLDKISSYGESFRAVHEPVGDRCGHQDLYSFPDSYQPRAITLHACVLPADDLEEERRAQGTQGKITQLATTEKLGR
jgi:hypothetical protein